VTNGRTWKAARVGAAMMLVVILTVPHVPTVSTFPYEPHLHSYLRTVDTWMDPGGGGEDLRFRVNTDGTRLLMVGYGSPGEVRVTDLDTSNATVLEPPAPGFRTKGCDWNTEEDQVVVWGDVDGDPLIFIHDLPSGEVDGSVPWLDLVDLASVTEVSFLADDVIVSVAGRDDNGTSRLMFIETQSVNVRADHEWEGNHTIVEVEDEGGEIVILDTGEGISVLGSSDWSTFRRYPGVLDGGPVSWHVPTAHPWGVADAEGNVASSRDVPMQPQDRIKVGEGPVTGFSWTMGRSFDFLAAMDAPSGGSTLAAWEIFPEIPPGANATRLCTLDVDGHVTMMSPDPRGWGRVLVAREDGSLVSVALVVRPRPFEMDIGDPDIPDGRGLEHYISWFPGGESWEPRFYFNNRGSLIGLMGFGSRNDVRVVDRNFETVAKLGLPGLPTLARGMEWSKSDSWLLVWGHEGSQDNPKLVLRAYDAPYFNKSITFNVRYVMDEVHDVFSLEFLEGDEVLVMSCLDKKREQKVISINVTTGEVISRVKFDEEMLIGIESNGPNLVGIGETGSFWKMSSPEWRPSRVFGDADQSMWAWDINVTSGWCFVGFGYNATVWKGVPRQEAVRWDVQPNDPVDLVWSNGRDGDMVLGMRRWAIGSSIQLWRQGPCDEDDWRCRDGFSLMTELNSSLDLVQLEADPAYPGMILAGFGDGTLVLYHLNLTPYPPPPDDLTDLDTGPIYPIKTNDGTDDGNGNGNLPWGSTNDWVFPVLLILAILGLVLLLVLMRRSSGRDDKED
jgi:hypothetical protein